MIHIPNLIECSRPDKQCKGYIPKRVIEDIDPYENKKVLVKKKKCKCNKKKRYLWLILILIVLYLLIKKIN
jgi:hypothetical protein